MAGEAGDDTLWGGADADTLSGGVGDDRVYGGAGDDLVSGDDGNDGNDSVFGHDGADTFDGGLGNDFLTGGGGSDRLVFAGANGQDTIDGFENGSDQIDFAAYAVNNVTDFDINQVGANTVISNYGGGKIRLDNTTAADIDDSDFIFA